MGMRTALISLGTAAVAALPLTALAATTDFFGPIIPQSGSCVCNTAMDWGCVIIVFQAVMNVLVSLSVLAVVFFIAWAGFTMITGGSNPANRTKARNRLVNAVIGPVVILGAWLVVDTVMKTLYNPDTAFQGGTFGPWNEIFAGGEKNYCLSLNKNPGVLTDGSFTGEIENFINPGTGNSSNNNQVGVTKGLCADSNKACSVSVMKSEGLTDGQARAMSCIAVTESGGNPNIGGSGTGAQGLFQITGTNWRNPAFHSSPCTVNSSRDNGDCNRQAAVLMLKKGGYQPWTGKCNNVNGCGKVSNGQYWNPNAVACVAKYDS